MAMKSLHQQQVLEKLRFRFGAAAGTVSSPESAGTPGGPAFPAAILKTGLHECLAQEPGDWAATVGFALLAASRAQESGKPVFILRLKNSLQEAGEIYGHGVCAFGLDASQVVTVSLESEKDLLWAAEEVVASQAAGAAIAALDAKEKLYGFTASRRLKLRTKTGGGPVFVLRDWRQGGATAAHSRWRIARLPSPPESRVPGGTELLGIPRLSAFLERSQGAPPSHWEIACHASNSFRVAPLLADGASRTASLTSQAA